MKKNRKPAIIVALAFLVLMIVPVVFLTVFGRDSASSEQKTKGVVSKDEPGEVVVDFELRRLSERADSLLSKDMADALRRGDVTLDFMADLKEDVEKANSALSGGQPEKAENLYEKVILRAENKLKDLELAEAARALSESAYAELQRLDFLKAGFENTYNEAVEAYDKGLVDLDLGNFEKSVDYFETTEKILKDLEKHSTQKIEALLEAADIALAELDFIKARSLFEKALTIDASNSVAKQGLSKLAPLEKFSTEIKSVQSLREAGELDKALEQIDELIAQDSNNPFLKDERGLIEANISELKQEAILKRVDAAEAEGDLIAAIAGLKEAIALRADPELSSRLTQLKKKEKAARLELLLETGYNALKAGSYAAAKQAYEDAVALVPKSEEAQTGLKKASNLYLANIRYSQNIDSAAKYLSEGRFPLAGKFFNDAMASRPSNLTISQIEEESRIRKDLAAQNREVSVRLVSDNKTYVSLIGVFAPEQFREKEIKLFPDVYKLKGTRRDHQPVEVEIQVDTRLGPQTTEIICTEKQ